MPETRGYQTIVDRTDGFGPGIDPDALPTVDAPFEPPRDDDPQPTDRDDVYDADGNVILGDNDGTSTMPGAQRRWTRELEQRFSRRAQFNPDIEDRVRNDEDGNPVIDEADLRGEGDVTLEHTTKVHAGTQDAYDEDSYSARIYNRPTHQGQLYHLEGDFYDTIHRNAVANGDSEADADALVEFIKTARTATYNEDVDGNVTITGAEDKDGNAVALPPQFAPNALNRDRLSGWGITVQYGERPGAGAWSQGTEQQRPLDGVTYYPDTGFADAELPNADTEHQSDYIEPDELDADSATAAGEEVE